MRYSFLWTRSRGQAVAASLLALFVLLGLMHFSDTDGDDLSASYVGCRVLAEGKPAHLYSHDAADFAELGDDLVWIDAADDADFHGTLHPYVQTPLWAYALRPMCGRMDYPRFKQVFATLEMLCFAGIIWLIVWYWAPGLLNPVGMAAVLTVFWFSVPFQYAMGLMQTHVFFFAATVAALILAGRGRWAWAGLLLACAATVKLTPAVLVVYWLVTKRWKAAASAIVWSGMIAATTVAAVGWSLTAAYLVEVHRISRVLLLAMNNQSLAAWWMGRFYDAASATKTTILPLPDGLRVASTGLMVSITALGGWIDRRRRDELPLGAMMGLIAATVFAPIAWTHYSIVLLAPLLMLWQENRKAKSWAIWAGIILTVILIYRPLAMNVMDWETDRYSVLRSEFYACIVCLITLAWAARARSKLRSPVDQSNLRSQISRTEILQG